MNVIILGGGRIGSVIALDLANDKKNNVTMIMDCGLYPGMGSALIMQQ